MEFWRFIRLQARRSRLTLDIDFFIFTFKCPVAYLQTLLASHGFAVRFLLSSTSRLRAIRLRLKNEIHFPKIMYENKIRSVNKILLTNSVVRLNFERSTTGLQKLFFSCIFPAPIQSNDKGLKDESFNPLQIPGIFQGFVKKVDGIFYLTLQQHSHKRKYQLSIFLTKIAPIVQSI
jgi:hypothetical protein